MRLSLPFVLVSAVAFSSTAHARDWFVRAGSADGDGSLSKPFADPWMALDKSEAGDSIHVAVGKYYGKLGLGQWTIPYDNESLIGGYSADFKTRDPWRNLTELLWDGNSKNWPKDARITSPGKNVTVDGVVIDMVEQNEYTDPQRTGRRDKTAENAMRFNQAATVRNCVIVNPGWYGITARGGSLIENNLIVNAIGWGIEVQSGEKAPVTIKNNTIVFTWTFKDPGKGAYQGSSVSLQGPAVVTNNILADNDDQGIYTTIESSKIAITKNVFFMNLYANIQFSASPGQMQGIDDKSMDMLDEAGFKAYDGNVVMNPQLAIDPKWMDAYSRRQAGQPGKLVMDDWNKARQALGLDLIGGSYKQATGVAPPYDMQKALLLMAPKASTTAGARVIAVQPLFSGTGAAAVAVQRDYKRIDFNAFANNPGSVDGKAIETTVAINSVANIAGIPSSYDQKQHAGMFVYDPAGSGARAVAFYKTGSNAQRMMDDNAGWYQGSGKADRVFTVRGVAYTLSGSPKAGIFVESMEAGAGAQASSAAVAAARPQGRDWFVRAGAQGGDGSRDKPFKDPYQALEKVQSGDSIHVTEGEYNGKLKAGNWAIPTTYIALIGGYDTDFKTRNPWKHPTLLRTGADYKAHRQGYTIEGGQTDHTGTIIDGFVFDKQQDDKYKVSGDLDYDNSDKNESIWISRPQSIVRNCLFSNGAEGAIRTSQGVTFENNIIFNNFREAVKVQSGGFNNDPFVFRNNTVAFAWDIRFGQGHGATGTLITLGTRVPAIIDNNIFEFADNDAIRLNADAKDVELTNNTFAHNLWSNVQKPDGWVTVDDKSFATLSDFGWKKLSGNQVISANLPIDKKFFDVYLGRTAYVPGKVSMDDWNQLREILGQPMLATGGKAPEGLMPAYDWKSALAIVPKNPKVKAGARPKDIPVQFNGVARQETSYSYTDTNWDAAKSGDSWDKMQGQRVALKVAIKDNDSAYNLPDVKSEEYQAFWVVGPQGIDSGGTPMRVYVKKGTTPAVKLESAKRYNRGEPDQTYMVKGVARPARQMVVEVIEPAD